ncbi:MAG: hypothetical protein RLZZ444_605 [Pseudomonadota bacterium]
MARFGDWVLAIASGGMLAGMIKINSTLAQETTALTASWTAHAVGAAAAAVFVLANRSFSGSIAPSEPANAGRAPLWSYLGGVPGAFAVALSAMAVNSVLGLSTALAFLLAGQLLFGLFSDAIGLLGTPRRRLGLLDLLSVILVGLGSFILLEAGSVS